MKTYESRVDFENLLNRVEKLGGTIVGIREEQDSLLLVYILRGEEQHTFLISHPHPVRRQTMRFIYDTWRQELGSYRLEL